MPDILRAVSFVDFTNPGLRDWNWPRLHAVLQCPLKPDPRDYMSEAELEELKLNAGNLTARSWWSTGVLTMNFPEESEDTTPYNEWCCHLEYLGYFVERCLIWQSRTTLIVNFLLGLWLSDIVLVWWAGSHGVQKHSVPFSAYFVIYLKSHIFLSYMSLRLKFKEMCCCICIFF